MSANRSARRGVFAFLVGASLLALALGDGFAGSAAAAPVCTKTWTGAVSTAWTTAGNWSPSGVPAATAYACVPSTANDAVIGPSDTISVAGVRVNGGHLTVNGSLSLTDAAGTKSSELSSGFLDGSGAVTLATGHKLNWTGGSMVGSGQTVVASGATLAMDTSSAYLLLQGRSLVNNGTATYKASTVGYSLQIGDSTCANPATTFTNAGTFTYTGFATDFGISGDSCGDPLHDVIVNSTTGTITRTAGSGTAPITAHVENDGIVTANAGKLALMNGSGVSVGQFGGGTGKVSFDGGVFHLGSNASFAAGAGINGATVFIDGSVTSTALTITSGTVDGTGTLTQTGGTLKWTGGTMQGAGQTVVTSGATLAMDASSSYMFLVERGLTNAGTATYRPSTVGYNLQIGDPLCVIDGTTFTNSGTLSYLGTAGSDFGIVGTSCASPTNAVIKNMGTGVFQKTTGSATAPITASIDNDGSITAAAGTLSLNGGAGVSIGQFGGVSGGKVSMDGGTFHLDTNASFATGATITNATVFIDGSVHSTDLAMTGGTLDGSGTLTQTGGTLAWSGGTMQGAGQTVVSSPATLTLDASSSYMSLIERSLVNGGTATYTPSGVGYTFTVGDPACGATSTTFTNTGTLTYKGLDGSDFGLQGTSCSSPNSFIKNTGTFTKTTGTATAQIGPAIDNDGSITAAAGVLSLLDGLAGSTGQFGGASGGSVSMDGGTFHLDTNASFATGATITNATVFVDGSVSSTALTMSGGTIDGAGTLTQTGGTMNWDGGTMQGPGQTVIDGPATLTMDASSNYMSLIQRALINNGAATYTPSGVGYSLTIGDPLCAIASTTFTNNGTLSYLGLNGTEYGLNGTGCPSPTSSVIKNNGTFQKTAGTGTGTVNATVDNFGTVKGTAGTFALTGAFPAYVSGTKTLSRGVLHAVSPGKINVTGLDINNLSGTVILDGVSAGLNNESGSAGGVRNLAAITASGALTMKNGKVLASSRAVSNAGAVSIEGNATVTSFTAAGTYTQTGGTTVLTAATSQLKASAAPGKVILNGGVLSGIGTVQAAGSPSLSNGATVSPGIAGVGTLSVTGSYTQTSLGTLAVDDNGTGAGQADVLAVSGVATLGGTLGITTGYTPVLGDASKIVTAGSTAGAFSSATGADLPGDLSFQIKINPTDVTLRVVRPSISVADVTVAEGNSGTTTLTFKLTLSEASAATLSSDYATADGSATAGSDYTSTSGTATWNLGDALTKDVSVTFSGDNVYENDETLTLSLSNPVNLTLPAGPATGTIQNDDPIPTISVTGPSPVTEGDSGSTPAAFTVQLSNPSAFAVTFTLATSDGTATAGADYTAISQPGSIPALSTSLPVSVDVLGDTLNEGDETFSLGVSGVSGATPASASAQATIADDDVPAQVTVGDGSTNEGDSGQTTLTLPVTLSPAPTRTGSYVATVGGGGADTATGGTDCAAAGVDYIVPDPMLRNVAVGQTTDAIDVTVCGDTAFEPTETLTVSLGSATGGVVIGGSGVATGSIANDDSQYRVTAGDVNVSEAVASHTVLVPVHVTPASPTALSIGYSTADGTAIAGTDYTAKTGTLNVPANATTANISVTVINNAIVNSPANRVFYVNLSPTVAGAFVDDGQAAVTIQDDENPCTAAHPGFNVIQGTAASERILGTPNPDYICGLGGNDTIVPGGGGDVVVGGLGVNTVEYSNAPSAVTVNLATSAASGGSGNDTLTQIQNAIGSPSGDTFVPSSGPNTIAGGAGVDTVDYSGVGSAVDVNLNLTTVSGGSGTDKVTAVENAIGTVYNDHLAGSAAANHLTGGLGNDVLKGQAGNDVLDGGGGTDVVQYDDLATAHATGVPGVTVNLATGVATGDGTDTLIAVEDASGTAFGDVLIGNALQNRLTGGNGDDTIKGGDNPAGLLPGGIWPGDIIHAGNGNDPVLWGGPGPYDMVFGDPGTDGGAGYTNLSGDNITGADFAHDYCSQGDGLGTSWNHTYCENDLTPKPPPLPYSP